MQFPWLALLPASNLATNVNNSQNDSLFDAVDNDGIAGQLQGLQGVTASDNARLLRIWNCKKSDPTVTLFQKSQSRQLASLKPR
jgi:hypothetical protein